MHLIFGGAYQGKLDYAKERYNIKEEDIFSCFIGENIDGSMPEPKIDFSKKAIYGLEKFVFACIKSGKEPIEYFEEHRDEWRDSIILCEDISAGVVPYEKELRVFREMVGRTMMYLGKEAEEVTRMFCGIPQKIK